MDQLILGGDHLGPNPWRSEPIDEAMKKAHELVKLYVEAGFTKIHLDASMACGGEPNPSFTQIAERAAELCATAEAHAPDPEKLFYIIGTEVPIPGGETEEPGTLDVTSPERLEDTIQSHRDAWRARGLDAAWHRIASVVTQPGVDFGHTSIYPFIPEKAKPLGAAILAQDGLSFEAHSTDYQSNDALQGLVKNHFFFLKVGPELTFRFREAVWALTYVEDQIGVDQPSRLRQVMHEQMTSNPGNWKEYYTGSDDEVETLMTYSYSDRIRYYWPEKSVTLALRTLFENLEAQRPAETVLSQAFMGLEFGEIPADPASLIAQHVQRCVKRYYLAAGHR